jgi:copper(I)-binding protein/methionine-rich copper-binding protein CopC
MTLSLRVIAAFLALICAATTASAHAQLEKAAPSVGGTVASASEIRLTFGEGVEAKFSKISLTGPDGVVPTRGDEDGSRQSGCANRDDLQTPVRRRLQGALAGRLGGHASHPGNLRIHREAMTSLRKADGEKGQTMRHSLFTLALALAVSATPALAQEFKAGDIVVERPWARATPKGAEVGSGYLTIQNKGAAPDRLTGGKADFATVEIHQMSTENGVSQMRELKVGVSIPAKGEIGFSPGGYHLMFTHLTHPLMKGESFKATLNFEHAGAVEVEFGVMGIGASGNGGSGGAMKGMKM